MATNTRLVTFNAQNVTPQDDALLYETAIPQTGIIYGADLTANGTNTVHIDTGFGIVRGRFFEIFESDIAVPLSSSGEIEGRIIGRLDLSNIDEPFVILAQTGTLAPLRQDADVNIFNGVHEFLLATFMVDEITISSFVDVKPTTLGSQVIVNTLPVEGASGTIYLVPSGTNMIPWVYVNGAWKQVGADSYTKTEMDLILEKYQAKCEYVNVDNYTVNAASGAYTTTDLYTATKKYRAFITGYVQFANNATGRRIAEIQYKDATRTFQIARDARMAVSGGLTYSPTNVAYELNVGDKIQSRIWQNSGSALSCTIYTTIFLFPDEVA